MDPQLQVRFLYGDRWHPARVRKIRMDSLSVFTDSAPASGADIVAELSLAGLELQVRAVVVAVTTAELGVAVGGLGFGARFVGMSAAEMAQLDHMIAAANPPSRPPRRRHPRYRVNWPVQIRVGTEPLYRSAIDLSTGGFFIADDEPIWSSGIRLHFEIPLEDDGAVRARGVVVRRLDTERAGPRKLEAGVGVAITEMTDDNRARYARLIERVKERSRRFLMVLAPSAAKDAVQSALSPYGYPTVTYPNRQSSQTVDAVVLAGDYAPRGLPQKTPIIRVGNRNSGEIRVMVDRKLGIEVEGPLADGTDPG